MELSQLEYFKVLSRHKSFTKAAEALHLSQPALSISISKLEKELGVPLFDRSGSVLHLTSPGRAFLLWCNQALTAINSGVREARDMRDTVSGNVCIAVSEGIIIKHLVRDFLRTDKNASLQIYLLTHEQMRSAIYEGTVDFVISRGPLHGPEIFWTPLYDDHLMVLMSANNPLATRPNFRLEDLADEYFIIGDLVYGMESFVCKLCYSAGFTPKIRFQGHESDVAVLLESLENTVILACNSTAAGVRANSIEVKNLISRPIIDAVPESIGLGIRSNRYQSAAVQTFFDMVQDFYRSLPGRP